MDFLLDPNVAYLLLLGGIVLMLLAVVTPGTGVLEIGAIFCFLLAGYAVYNLSFHWWAFALLVLSLIPFGYAIKSRSRVFLGVSIFLMVIGSAFLFTHDGEWMSVNPVVALFSSGLLAFVFWVVGIKFLDTLVTRPTHDLDALIGQIGEARTAIYSDGSAYVNGEQWSAQSEVKIPKGSQIRVVRRAGFTLVVEKAE